MYNKLYVLISRAREACAGCSVEDKEKLRQLTKTALQYAVFIGAEKSIQDRLIKAYELIVKIEEYGDRLEPDNILCDILNEMSKQ